MLISGCLHGLVAANWLYRDQVEFDCCQAGGITKWNLGDFLRKAGRKLCRQQFTIDKEIMTLTVTRSTAQTERVIRPVHEDEELFAPDRTAPGN